MPEGWIKLHRSIQDNEFYLAERFTKTQAWIDLLILATHDEQRTIFLKGREIHLERGDLAWAQETLARRWKWNGRTVRRFLVMLERRKMVHLKPSNVTTVISILNYSLYQDSAEQSALRTQSEAQAIKNENKGHNVKSKKPPLDLNRRQMIEEMVLSVRRLETQGGEMAVSEEDLERLRDRLPATIDRYGLERVRQELSYALDTWENRFQYWGREEPIESFCGYLLTCLRNNRQNSA